MKRMIRSLGAVLVVPSLAAGVGCSGGDSDDDNIDPPVPIEACDDEFTACGGDVIGTWLFTSFCVADPVAHPIADCPAATLTPTRYEIEQTVTLAEDGTYTETVVGLSESTVQVPTGCLEITCGEYERFLSSNSEPGRTYAVDCSVIGTECVCYMDVTIDDRVSGTFEFLGDSIVVTDDRGEVTDYGYCVAGDTLTLGISDEGSMSYERITVTPPTPVPACQDTFTACGGDVVGTWSLTSGCLTETVAQPISSCPDAMVTLTSVESTETLVLGDDGSYTETVAGLAESTVQVPSACMEITCGEYGENLSDASEPGITIQAECGEAGPICECELDTTADYEESGTYTLTGNSLVRTAPDGEVADYEYCVSGDVLTISSDDSMGTYARVTP